MSPNRFRAITSRFDDLRIAVVGDFCLDRYLEIDPARSEISIETGLPVHNIVNVRAQPGAAGTVLNNLLALGIGKIYPIGFVGTDGEGHELWQALAASAAVSLDHLLVTQERRTFTYCKPLLVRPHAPPEELNRLDFKNWSVTPDSVQNSLLKSLRAVQDQVDAVIVLDQVSVPETGVVTRRIVHALGELGRTNPDLPILADSRRTLADFSDVSLKMNAAELASLINHAGPLGLEQIRQAATIFARQRNRNVFITLAEAGILAVSPDGLIEHEQALPLRSKTIDVVGAGDAVTSNLAAALAAGSTLREAIQLANRAASIVIHKLGTTGTASTAEIAALLT